MGPKVRRNVEEEVREMSGRFDFGDDKKHVSSQRGLKLERHGTHIL